MFWRVFSSRAVRVLLYLWILAWGFDRAIFWATEAAWFESVGQGVWFGARFLAQFGLFWGTFLVALVCAALAMRIAARPAPGAELRVLPSALERLEPLRRVAPRVAWLVLVVGAWIVARHVAGGWSLILAARAGHAADPVWGLPLARLALGGVWQWSLTLLGALAFAGGLRVLPLLAQREPASPLRLWRALSALGALALLARGALYLLAASEAAASDGTTGIELFIGWPVAVIGAALCLWAMIYCLRRPGYKRLGIAVVLALVAPVALKIVLAPLGLVLAAPASVEARNRANTVAAWNLDDAPAIGTGAIGTGAFGTGAIGTGAPPLAAHWPIWNEEALLGEARGEFGRNPQHIIDWRRATVEPGESIVAGVPAGLENWGSPHDADAQNGIEWLALDATQSADNMAPILPNAALPLRSFYGIGGRALLGDATTNAGVPFRFWGWKFAWAWRLRDPLLMLEGARAERLLVFRGARECAERLAPFLDWDEAQLRMTSAGPRWELVGYASTPDFRGAQAARQGVFAGQNSAVPAVVLSIEPRDGRAEFARPERANWSAPWAKVLDAPATQRLEATPVLDETRAQIARDLGRKNVLSEPVWSWSAGAARRIWSAPNLPDGTGERLAALDAAARRDWTRQDAKLRLGDAVLWPDARAPGGFWVGRSYYQTQTAAGVASEGGIAQSAKLWRVSLTGILDSPLANGEDTRAALVAFDLQKTPAVQSAPGQNSGPVPNAGKPVTPKELALGALRAHDAAQKAAAASKWEEWAKQSNIERQLLQQLATRDGKN